MPCALVRRKYRRLFSGRPRCRPGPQGPSEELIAVILEMKRRNPRFGCPRIAQQVSNAFGIEIDKDVVRRILAKHYRPKPAGEGPSWLTLIAHASDSLWSVDLFRCESITLKSLWVMLVMDLFTRRIVGVGVEPAVIDGVAVCRMFNHARCGQRLPRHLSTDHDPLFRFHRWRANLRILEIEELKSVPFVPRSHPFIERLIGTVRREYLDRLFFWNGRDLQRKLERFAVYYNPRQRSRCARWSNALGALQCEGISTCRSASLRLAIRLRRLVPHADRRVISNPPGTQTSSPRQALSKGKVHSRRDAGISLPVHAATSRAGTASVAGAAAARADSRRLHARRTGR